VRRNDGGSSALGTLVRGKRVVAASAKVGRCPSSAVTRAGMLASSEEMEDRREESDDSFDVCCDIYL